MKNRFSTLPFPSYTHIPGLTPHPEKEGGHHFNQQELKEEKIFNSDEENCFSETFCYGIDLLNHEFFWESHVLFEICWNQEGRKGEKSDFLKGLIKLGACGVKLKMKEEKLALEHFHRGRDLFSSITKTPHIKEISSQLVVDLSSLAIFHNHSLFIHLNI